MSTGMNERLARFIAIKDVAFENWHHPQNEPSMSCYLFSKRYYRNMLAYMAAYRACFAYLQEDEDGNPYAPPRSKKAFEAILDTYNNAKP